MAEQATSHPLTFMCHVLQVNRAGYYRWQDQPTRPPSPRIERHRQIAARIQAIFAETHGRVGRRPMRSLLAQDGIACAPGTVHRIMAEQDLCAARCRAWKRTTRREPAARTTHITNHCQDETGRRSFTSDQAGDARSATSPTSRPGRAGSIWPSSSTWRRAR